MAEITVSPEEVAACALSESHREDAVRSVLEDGYVVLKDVVSLQHLDSLHERMIEDLEMLRRRDDAPFNWNAGNLQQDPPPFPPYLFKDILLNEQVIAVTSALLGPRVKNHYYSGNTALPSEHRQPVHADSGHLWPSLSLAHPPAQLVVNVPTVDVSAENGSTEIWPGTHMNVTITAGKDIKVPPEAREARRRICPPIQPQMSRGSVLIRDIRLWHAGMPNRTAHPRPMIAMIHCCGWLATHDSLKFPAETEEFFKHPILHTCAQFVHGPIDHISAPHAYEYPH